MLIFAVFSLIVYFGMVTQATLGFGSNVLIVTFAAHLLPISEIVPLIVPINIVISGYITWRYRHEINTRFLFRRMLPLMVLGLPLGFLIFVRGSDNSLKTAFGGLIVVLAAIELYRHRRGSEEAEPAAERLPGWLSAGCLFGAGVIHGLYTSGGPLSVYVTSREITEKGEFRATMTALWVTLNAMMTVLYLYKGYLNADNAWKAGLLLIPTVAGIASGIALHDRLPKKTFRMLVYLLLLGSGASLLLAS
ncbi:MAG: sulfite exporter TauE/SafE family protein [Myxococcales bacterium]|nr:sulfite exporter TauE/SafE family protein [Myxococcales bacterium]